MHCEEAPCVRVCPVTATFVDRDGLVLVDQDKCIGCRLCIAACPYEARYFNWTEPKVKPLLPTKATPEFPSPQQRGTVGKCVLCVHNIKYGELPYCVDACTMDALYIGDLDADVATNGTETVRLSTFLSQNNAIRLKEELNTKPRVWYIPGHGEDLEW
jgi:molybdopterin-containing oxidoreductase family iron-sulfur binding subunit